MRIGPVKINIALLNLLWVAGDIENWAVVWTDWMFLSGLVKLIYQPAG